MNNFNAKEIQKSALYIQERLEMFQSKEAVKKIVLQNNNSLLKRFLDYLKVKR